MQPTIIYSELFVHYFLYCFVMLSSTKSSFSSVKDTDVLLEAITVWIGKRAADQMTWGSQEVSGNH